MAAPSQKSAIKGFTLIEISIVLVIIGLLVAGVLVGQNLIAAASVRAQVTQIEKFNQATNTFFGKFNAWPGDMDPASAANFGLPTHIAPSAWGASNDGLIQGLDANGLNGEMINLGQGYSETGQFWADMASTAGGQLVEGNFSGVNAACGADINSSNASTCMPAAKIGSANTNYISVYTMNSANWFGLGAIAVTDPNEDLIPSGNALTNAQAYSIDQKMDDGLPSTGNVIAAIVPLYVSPGFTPSSKHAASATSCWDNGNVKNATENYTLSFGGNGLNCVLSFKIQGGD